MKAIYRHETGRSVASDRDDLYRQLYCSVFGASPHDLFGEVGTTSDKHSKFHLTSHKFVPVFVGSDVCAQMARIQNADLKRWEWTDAWSTPVEHPHGRCTLYVMPWGALVFHIEEDVIHSSIAYLAGWREMTHEREKVWVDSWLAVPPATPNVSSHYVFSAFWLHEPAWIGAELETAMRLLCTPAVLLNRADPEASTAHAELVERTLLNDGYDDPRITSFGSQGTSIGYASWSGVSYHPLAEPRALEVSRFVSYEAVVQGLWTYCHHIRSQVEGGSDPVVPNEYGWRWLRAMRSKLEGARPQETGQQAALREAILHTSELSRHLASTLEIVRDCTVSERA